MQSIAEKTYNVINQEKKQISVCIIPVCPENEVTKAKSHKRKKKVATERKTSREKYLENKSEINSGNCGISDSSTDYYLSTGNSAKE